jgi:signal transduction histidine kinase
MPFASFADFCSVPDLPCNRGLEQKLAKGAKEHQGSHGPVPPGIPALPRRSGRDGAGQANAVTGEIGVSRVELTRTRRSRRSSRLGRLLGLGWVASCSGLALGAGPPGTPLREVSAEAAPLRPWTGAPVRAFSIAVHPVTGGADLNGDGFSDVAVGGPLEGEAAGQVSVFFGGPNGLGREPGWVLQGDGPNQHTGFSVSTADVTGDGFGDLMISDWRGIPGRLSTNEMSSVRVFPGSAQGLPARAAQEFHRRAGRFELRCTLATVGDLNGDGCAELAVEAVDPDHATDEGRCLVVFFGSREGLRAEPRLVFHSEQADCNFPARFGGAGDVNGDGFGDLLVSAPRYRGRFSEGGKVYLFLGAKDGLASQPAWTAEYPLPFDPRVDGGGALFFGWGLGAAGDVNRDGFGDVMIGAWNGSRGDSEEGLAFLFLGNRSGLASEPAWWVEGNGPHLHLGAAVRGVGDLNGDGFADVAVGAPYASHGQKDEGVVAVFHGSSAGLGADPAWTYDGDRSNGRMGEYVGPAGDVNGDGVPDLLLAGVEVSAGQALLRPVVLYGRRGGPVPTSAWSWRKPWTTAVGQWFDRLPRRVVWGSALVGAALLAGGLLWAHFRLRRELARVIAENRRLAAMQERARIARDMHDHLGADLTRLAAQLDRGASASEPQPRPVSVTVAEWQTSAQQAVKTLDELVWATNPTQDTLEGLAGYLAEFGPDFLNAHGLACELDVPSQMPSVVLPSRARHNLFLIAKEALRNVVRHANATKVRLGLTATPSRLELIVEDDGRGWSPASAGTGPAGGDVGEPGQRPRASPGNGIPNMQARASELGGVLRVETTPTGGTRVVVELPLGGSGGLESNSP